MIRASLIMLLLTGAFTACALGAEPANPDNVRRKKMHDAVSATRVTIDARDAPAREVIDSIRVALPVPVIARYSDDRFVTGIDPARPISVAFTDAPAWEVIEEILAQCDEPGDECTWQIRKGFVELGTKSRLSLPAACERRIYDVNDVAMVIPKDNRPPGLGGEKRKVPETGGVEVVRSVVETIEPEIWDWGQRIVEDEEGHQHVLPPAAPTTTAPAPARTRGRGPTYQPPLKIGIIRVWRGHLIVIAPDYVHRRIAGYGDPAVIDG